MNIGVKVMAGELEAHAWVVHDGRVLADSAEVAGQFQGRFESASGRLEFVDRLDRG